jgi:P-type Cu2+ transporter
VERVGAQTRFSEIVGLMESASTTKPPIAQLADRIAKPFLIGVLLAAGLACAYWWPSDPGHALMVAVAVLVVTCPCALSLATPAAMLSAAGNLAKGGVLVRRLAAFEAMASVDTVMFDKTGTLTRDAMVLASIQVRDGVPTEYALDMAAALARYSLHPVSKALVAASNTERAKRWHAELVKEVAGSGVSGKVWQGDLSRKDSDSVSDVSLGSAEFCAVSASKTEAKTETLRSFLSDEQGWLATFEFDEDVRSDALSTVEALQKDGIEVFLVSGDSAQAVARVAAQVGITSFLGGCTPQDKLAFLQDAQKRGKKVAVVGDGLNDGPVLAGAHVSFAFGRAVPLAQAQSDFVVLGEQLGLVVKALGLAKQTMCVVKQNLWWAAGYNALCVPLAVMGLLPAWLAGLGMALSSLFVVLNALRLAKSKSLQEI